MLHTFDAYSGGVNPNGDLIKDRFGKLYGTTVYGGSNGTLFKLRK